jgi:GNAT superfamily N-acetyltransferase
VLHGYLPTTLLSAAHDVGRFNCGKEQLDIFLRRYALKNQKLDSSQTWVTCPASAANRVVGYYSLAFGAVLHKDAPPYVTEGMPGYPIPVMLLAKLAVDREFRRPVQNLGLGSALLKDALTRTVQAAQIGGLRAMLVDAIDEEAIGFYRRFGFVASPTDRMQMFLPMAWIRASIEASSS